MTLTSKVQNFLSGNSDLPAAKQKTPFNINRWVLLFIGCIYMIISSWPYFAWSPIATILFESGVYKNLCSIDVNEHKIDPQFGLCNEQYVAVQRLFIITWASQCINSALGGIALDKLGQRLALTIGCCLQTLGYVLVGFGNVSSIFLILGFILIGGSCDTVYIGVMPVANLFPGLNSFVCGLLGASASFSTIMAPFMLFLYKTFNFDFAKLYFISLFGLVFVGTISVGALFLFPSQSYLTQDQIDKLNNAELVSVNVKDKKDNSKGLLSIILKPPYILMGILYPVVSITSVGLYEASSARLLLPSAKISLVYFIALSWIPCVILGKVADIVGIPKLIIFLNSTQILMHLFVIPNILGVHFLSITSFSVYISFLTLQFYLFNLEFYDQQYVGSLSGLSNTISGVFSLLGHFFFEKFILSKFPNDRIIFPMILAVSVAALFPAKLISWKLLEKKKK